MKDANEALPTWVAPFIYEYDLGMSTSCEVCGEELKEGQTAYEDIDPRPPYRALYCSPACCRKADTQ